MINFSALRRKMNSPTPGEIAEGRTGEPLMHPTRDQRKEAE